MASDWYSSITSEIHHTTNNDTWNVIMECLRSLTNVNNQSQHLKESSHFQKQKLKTRKKQMFCAEVWKGNLGRKKKSRWGKGRAV
jgi:hypothetical protein